MQQELPFTAEGTPLWDGMPKAGGFLSMTVLPHHVSNPDKVDRVAWMLLTLLAHLDFSVKAFKVACLVCSTQSCIKPLHPCNIGFSYPSTHACVGAHSQVWHGAWHAEHMRIYTGVTA